MELEKLTIEELKDLKKKLIEEIKKRNVKKYPNKKKGWYYIGLLNDGEIDYIKDLFENDLYFYKIRNFCRFFDGKGIVDTPFAIGINENLIRGYHSDFCHLEYLIHKRRKEYKI